MKKKYVVILVVAAVLIVASVGVLLFLKEDEKKEIEEDYPQIVYIDDCSYYGTDEVCEMVPRRNPDGKIDTFVPKEIMPDSYNSANFGSEYESLEYMFLEDGKLIVHVGELWYFFE